MTKLIPRPWVNFALLLMLSAGCETMPPLPQHPAPLPAGGTYLLHLPGIAGDSPFDRWWMNELKLGGAADRVELYDWTCHDPWFGALQAYARNHREAQKIADKIVEHLGANPTAKVVVTAESGGAGPLIWALEKLPAGAMVDDVMLLAPAISPDYDLSAALSHVRGKAYAFTSAGDWLMLGWGTSTFGTIDGKKVQAAGRYGFVRPKLADMAEYKKLVQFPYDSAWMRYFNFGSHAGAMSPSFARHFLAPLLVQDEHPVQTSSAAHVN
jgi:hypothetical protein